MNEPAINSSILITDNEDLVFHRKSKILSALSQLVHKEINNLKFELLGYDAEYSPSVTEQLPCFTISKLINLSHQQSDHECNDLHRNLINETKLYLLKKLNDEEICKKSELEAESDVNSLQNANDQLKDNQTVNLFANSFLVELIDDSINKNNMIYQCNDNNNNNTTTSILIEQKEELAESYSYNLSEQIITESFERIFHCSLYAKTLVNELFDDFYQMSATPNQTDDVKLIIDELKENNSNLCSFNSSVLTPNPNISSVNNSSTSSLQINDSNNLSSMYRRHSADVSRFINSIASNLTQTSKAFMKYSNPLSTIAARRHSFNTFETSYKMRFDHLGNQLNLNESDNSSSQSCIDANPTLWDKNVSSSGTTSGATKSRNRMFRTSCSSTKKPIVTVLSESTATVDSQSSDLVAQMPSASLTNQTVSSNTSNSNISCDTASGTTSKMPFIQYAKLTLKNLFTPNTNKTTKSKSNYSSLNSQPLNVPSSSPLMSFVNEFSNQILVSAFDDIALLTNSIKQSNYVNEFSQNLFDESFEQIKSINFINENLKHIHFKCDHIRCSCFARGHLDSLDVLDCQITIFLIILALNELNFLNQCSFECLHFKF